MLLPGVSTTGWLVVGVQALIWTDSGLYMTAVHIAIIHGDHFIRSAPMPLPASELLSPAKAAASTEAATGLTLTTLLDRPVYVLKAPHGDVMVDARTGVRVPPPSRGQIRQTAEHWFTGHEKLERLTLIREIPGEIRGRKPPLWRADFGGWNKPTLYISPATGELVSRRHELWRILNFVWMLHIMDYD